MNTPSGMASSRLTSVDSGKCTTMIIGDDIGYSGSASMVVGTGTPGAVCDAGAGAALSFFGGSYTLSVTGNNDTVKLDADTSAQAMGPSANAEFNLGTPFTAGGANAATTTGSTSVNVIDITLTSRFSDIVNVVAGSSNRLFLTTAIEINETGDSTTVVTGAGGVVTLTAPGGDALVFDFQRGNLINANTSIEFVVAGSTILASTYNAAAGGADTIFAGGAAICLGMASSSFFLGGAGAVTVSAAAAETVFGGSGGGCYSVGATRPEFFFGGGSSDTTIIGGVGSPSIFAFGMKNKCATIAPSTSTTGKAIVSFVDKDKIDMTNAGSGSDFIITNKQTLSTGLRWTCVGGTTLIGSHASYGAFAGFDDDESFDVLHIGEGNYLRPIRSGLEVRS